MRALYGVLTVLLVAYIVSEVVRRDGQSWPAIDNWGVAGFEIVASLLCMARALPRVCVDVPAAGRARLLPVILGAGLLCWSLGDLAVAIAGGATPLGANVFYLAFYPISYVAVMMLMSRQIRRFTAETWLDGIIAGLGAAALCSAFLFHGVLRAAGGSSGVVATNLAYPIGDLLLLSIVIGGTAALPGRRRLPWLLLAVGFAVNTLGDTANLFASSLGATHFGSAANAVAWPTSILLVSLSVWVKSRPAVPLAQQSAPNFIAPGLAMVCSVAILFVGSISHLGLAALCLAAATLGVAGLRFGLSVTGLRELTADRHRQAVTDQLTTLGNRRALFELFAALAEERNDSSVERREFAVLFVDLNRFKEVNDSFGHSVGDELLRQLGERLSDTLRSCDLLARLGGDEFAVMLLNAGSDYGAMVARRISSSLEEPFQLGSVRARIGASIGIAACPGDAVEAEDLLRCADLAMYRAKVEGKPFAIYNREVDGAGGAVGMVEELRAAIEQHTVELHYQPQISMSTGEVMACEALVRWQHPEQGYLPPLAFLPLAEDAGLMDQLTDLVLDMALAQCARWRTAGREVTVGVNLSATNLLNPDLPSSVRAALERHQVPPTALVLEITETTAIGDFGLAKRAIESLRDIGTTV
ncbi:MAG TPA: diguanylate cyclase, partial [Solirubrobacteraceae bacterium]|nr:diguanylate cyclase [Solirubrobacteraceae bacterium]